MIRMPKSPETASKGAKKHPDAPILPAQWWGEETAKLLFEILPRCPGETMLDWIEIHEVAFRKQYADWPAAGLERAVDTFKSSFRKTWEKLAADLPVTAKGGYAGL
jgi:hypothetical protein